VILTRSLKVVIVGLLAMTSIPAVAQTPTDKPVKIQRVHLGAVACQFQVDDGTWYGIEYNTLPKLGQCLGVLHVWQNHGAIDVSASLTGNMVPCNVSICGMSTVPEISNILIE
jgi:hypothetical protein